MRLPILVLAQTDFAKILRLGVPDRRGAIDRKNLDQITGKWPADKFAGV